METGRHEDIQEGMAKKQWLQNNKLHLSVSKCFLTVIIAGESSTEYQSLSPFNFDMLASQDCFHYINLFADAVAWWQNWAANALNDMFAIFKSSW